MKHLDQLERNSDRILQSGIAFVAILFCLLTAISYPIRYITLPKWNLETGIWFENLSGYTISPSFKKELSSKLIDLGYPGTPVLRNGRLNKIHPGQAQIFFLRSTDLTLHQLIVRSPKLGGEANPLNRTANIYLDRILRISSDPSLIMNVTIHELGHAMGALDHNTDNNNIMYPILRADKNQKQLNQDQMKILHSEWFSNPYQN